MIKSIWSTPEAEAWSRGFGYEDYLRLCSLDGTSPLSKSAFDQVGYVFETDMKNNIQ